MNASDSTPCPQNRLALATSPYLQQHAHNPVDWYPWGEEAFAKARREDKPIFLSVGYSTCHWCHVMAHESFEDPGLARLLNSAFVCIKVDREERPDIDRIYMTYVQAVTRGGGGWPMSVWLTPDLKPIYGGTYFPPEDRYGRPGFARVLESLAEAWRTSRSKLEAAGDDTVRRLQTYAAAATAASPTGADALESAAAAFLSAYDPADGGFGGPPKFPRPSVFAFLLRQPAPAGGRHPREAVLHTLRKMADGGLHDHLGGGFHRYATDAAWLIPHFEKMLYDQAQLVCAYLEAWQVDGEPLFADVARSTLAYVRRDLTGPEGQFYSAEDADSPLPGEHVGSAEGAFYTWTRREVLDALGEAEGSRFADAFGLGRDDTRVEGRHVLAVSREDARGVLAHDRGTLLEARARRARPHLDDKALTAWNGLMISACARAYQLLENPQDLTAAQRAADFVRHHLTDTPTGRLRRTFRNGLAAVDGFAEDYACLIQGLLDLYEADFDTRHLEWALALQACQDERFWDPASGGYFSSAPGAVDVLFRIKEMHDGAEPSAGSVSAMNLLRLAAITGSESHRTRTEALFGCFASRLREQPESVPLMLAARADSLCPPTQIVIAGERDAADTLALLRVVRQHPARNRVVLLADGGSGQAFLTRLQPAIGPMRPVSGRAAAYVCLDFTCRTPVTEPEALVALLQQCNQE